MEFDSPYPHHLDLSMEKLGASNEKEEVMVSAGESLSGVDEFDAEKARETGKIAD